jgi:hypothetical protein
VPSDRSDVDLYHFQVTGPGRFAFASEVFAGRIGSPLNPGASLFSVDPANGSLHLVAGNDDTRNPIPASNHRSLPLYGDAAVFAGLTQGNYYLAVSSRGNVPDPDLGLLPGVDGIFDPDVSHSGSAGRSFGPYVLNLKVSRDDVVPTVESVTPGPDSATDGPPTQIAVRFSAPMNLRQLAFRAFERNGQDSLSAVFVLGSDGTRYYPRLDSYDTTTNEADFLLLDRLASGSYALHLSGSEGLADYAGTVLAGNDPSGDYVTHFAVGGAPAPVLPLSSQEPNDEPSAPEDLGVLFPHELESGVTIVRDYRSDPAQAPRDTADSYGFEVLQEQSYFFVLSGAGVPPDVRLTLTDASGDTVAASAADKGGILQTILASGRYVIRVSGWGPGQAAAVVYQLKIALGGLSENPQPLTVGPVPVLRLQLVGLPLPVPPPPISSQPPATPQLDLGPVVGPTARLFDVTPPAAVDAVASGAPGATGANVPTNALLAASVFGQSQRPAPLLLSPPSGVLAALGSGLIGPVPLRDSTAQVRPALTVASVDPPGATIQLASGTLESPVPGPSAGPGDMTTSWFPKATSRWAHVVERIIQRLKDVIGTTWIGIAIPADRPSGHNQTSSVEVPLQDHVAPADTAVSEAHEIRGDAPVILAAPMLGVIAARRRSTALRRRTSSTLARD